MQHSVNGRRNDIGTTQQHLEHDADRLGIGAGGLREPVDVSDIEVEIKEEHGWMSSGPRFSEANDAEARGDERSRRLHSE